MQSVVIDNLTHISLKYLCACNETYWSQLCYNDIAFKIQLMNFLYTEKNANPGFTLHASPLLCTAVHSSQLFVCNPIYIASAPLSSGAT